MLFTGWMACLFVTSGPFPPLLTLATSSNTHTMGAAGNGANLWNESQSDRENTFVTIHYHRLSFCSRCIFFITGVLDFIDTYWMRELPCLPTLATLLQSCFSFVLCLFVFPQFHSKHTVYGHSWIQSQWFSVLLEVHAGTQLTAALYHDWKAESSLPAVLVSCVVMCSHSALDVPAFWSVAWLLPVVTVCFIAPVGTACLEIFSTHSVWTVRCISNKLSTPWTLAESAIYSKLIILYYCCVMSAWRCP